MTDVTAIPEAENVSREAIVNVIAFGRTGREWRYSSEFGHDRSYAKQVWRRHATEMDRRARHEAMEDAYDGVPRIYAEPLRPDQMFSDCDITPSLGRMWLPPESFVQCQTASNNGIEGTARHKTQYIPVFRKTKELVWRN